MPVLLVVALLLVVPPTLIVVGEADHLVPVDGTYRVAERARATGVEVELIAVPYADHVFDGRRGSIGQQAYRQLTPVGFAITAGRRDR